MKETERDIYYNSCIHWSDSNYYNGKEINIYLIDRRFITNLNTIVDYFENNDCYISDCQDEYYLIIKINKYFNKEEIFKDLLVNELIMSLYDFVIIYKPIIKY